MLVTFRPRVVEELLELLYDVLGVTVPAAGCTCVPCRVLPFVTADLKSLATAGLSLARKRLQVVEQVSLSTRELAALCAFLSSILALEDTGAACDCEPCVALHVHLWAETATRSRDALVETETIVGCVLRERAGAA